MYHVLSGDLSSIISIHEIQRNMIVFGDVEVPVAEKIQRSFPELY
ncbi:MAG TPA: hypothetical protein VFG46_20525 [Chryseolinea sp.]|nr:hypothetical protein [Chryseolinea sp.]